MSDNDEIDEMTGPQKAAVIMFAMGEERAARLFGMMDDDEIKELSQTMANLGMIDAKMVESLFIIFAKLMSGTGSLVGSFESTERLLVKSLGAERVEGIMEEIRGPAGRTMWDKLGNVNEATLATYLKNEYPQTVAVVLSKLKPDHASRVIAELPEEFAMEVIVRMLSMESVRKEILDGVEQTLRTEFMSNLARTARRDSHEMIAEMFNNFDRATEARFMTALEERSRESAERIKALMFTFEDLSKLDPGSVQTLLRVIEKNRLAIALKGASETLRDLFFSNMSERAGKILREEMDAMGPVRLKDVDEAQMEIVTKAKELAASGEIVIAEGGGEDELIY
jgi:flagellar motor switch protein FliG